MLRRGVVVYVALTVGVLCVSYFWMDRSLWVHPAPWLSLAPVGAASYSSLLGVTLAAVVVVGSRHSVLRFDWARRLHRDFSPVARQLSSGGIVVLALASALGEELLFRGLLQPLLGPLGQALLFGLVHQISGPSRWVWVLWAGAVGLLLGLLFQFTGSLLGPVAAHALINGLNLNFLKWHEPTSSRSGQLGGLLDRGGSSVGRG